MCFTKIPSFLLFFFLQLLFCISVWFCCCPFWFCVIFCCPFWLCVIFCCPFWLCVIFVVPFHSVWFPVLFILCYFLSFSFCVISCPFYSVLFLVLFILCDFLRCLNACCLCYNHPLDLCNSSSSNQLILNGHICTPALCVSLTPLPPPPPPPISITFARCSLKILMLRLLFRTWTSLYAWWGL